MPYSGLPVSRSNPGVATASTLLGDKDYRRFMEESGQLQAFESEIEKLTGTKLTRITSGSTKEERDEFNSRIPKFGNKIYGRKFYNSPNAQYMIDEAEGSEGSNFEYQVFDQLEKNTKEQAKAAQIRVDTAKTAIENGKKVNTAIGKVESELEGAIRNAQKLTRNLEVFSKVFENSQQGIKRSLDRRVSSLTGANSSLLEVGAIDQKEYMERSFNIQRSSLMAESNLKTNNDFMSILASRFDPNSTYDAEAIKKREGTQDRRSQGSAEQVTVRKIQNEERPGRSNFTNAFNEFTKQNLGQIITLEKISGFLATLNINEKTSKEILQDIAISGDANSALLRDNLKSLKINRNQMERQNAVNLINKNATQMISPSSLANTRGAFNMGGTMRDGEGLSRASIEYEAKESLNRGVIGGPADHIRDAAGKAQAQMALESMFGVSLTSITGRTGLDNRESIFEYNARELGEEAKSPSEKAAVEKIVEEVKAAFQKMRETEDHQNKVFEGLQMGFLSGLEPQKQLVGLQSKFLPKLEILQDIKNLLGGKTSTVTPPVPTPVPGGSPIAPPVHNPVPGNPPVTPPVPPVQGDLSDIFNNLSENLNNSLDAAVLRIESSNEFLSSNFTEMSDRLMSIPGEIKNEIQNAVFNHSVKGSVEIQYNTEELKNALGQELSSKLEEILSSGTTSLVIAKAVEGLIKIRANQIIK